MLLVVGDNNQSLRQCRGGYKDVCIADELPRLDEHGVNLRRFRTCAFGKRDTMARFAKS